MEPRVPLAVMHPVALLAQVALHQANSGHPGVVVVAVAEGAEETMNTEEVLRAKEEEDEEEEAVVTVLLMMTILLTGGRVITHLDMVQLTHRESTIPCPTQDRLGQVSNLWTPK